MQERNVRVISLLQELTAKFLQNEANVDPMITVTNVTISPDFKRATIFVTVYPEERDNEAIAFLKRKGSELRNFVKKKANLKHIPFFDFSIDYGEKNRQRIDKISNEKN